MHMMVFFLMIELFQSVFVYVNIYQFLFYRLAESCSHVGAVLYAMETGVCMCETITCTMEKYSWSMPTHVKKVQCAFSPINSILYCFTRRCMGQFILSGDSNSSISESDFSSAKKRRLNDKIIGKAPVPSKSFNVQCPPSPDSFTHDQLFDTLSKNYPSAILTVQEKHCKNVIPRSCTDILPKLVMEYKNSTASPIPEDSLDNFSKTFELPQITPQQIIMVSKRQESSQNQNYGINKELEESLLPN